MGFRRVLGWLMFLSLLGGASGGSYAWYLWTQTDEMLHQKISAAMKESIPDWNISFRRARFDFQGQIRIYDIHLKSKDLADFLILPEMVVSVDREQLGLQRLVIQQIKLIQPQLSLSRTVDGRWNWEDIGTIPAASSPNPPEIIIERGVVRLSLQLVDSEQPAAILLKNAHFQLTPSGKKRFLVKGDVLCEPAGTLALDGQCHLDNGAWQMHGNLRDMRINSQLWDAICAIKPDFRELIASLPDKLGFPLEGEPVTDPCFNVLADIALHLEQGAPTEQDSPPSEMDFQVKVQLKSGEWTHPLSPYPLGELNGEIDINRHRLLIEKLNAKHESLQLLVRKLSVDFDHPELPASVMIGFRDLPLVPETRARLSATLKHVYDQVQPAGKVDLNMHLTYSHSRGLQCDSDTIPKFCTAAHEKFPYPLHDVTGTIKKRGHMVRMELTGMAGQREVKLKGWVRSGQDDPGARIDVEVNGVPLDNVFLEACPLQGQNVLRSMNAQGNGNIRCRMLKSGGPETNWVTTIRCDLKEASVNCKCFPLPISGITGEVDWDGKNWTFRNLEGIHGSSQITAEGQFLMQGKSGELDLSIQTVDSTFDGELERALPESWKKLWKEFSPKGRFDCQTSIKWSPGGSPDIELKADLHEAEFQLQSMPYPVSSVDGKITFGRDPKNPRLMRADLINITGRHDETRISLKSGFATVEPNHQWRVRLEDLLVEDLRPDNTFRRSLPKGFREVVDTLDPREGNLTQSGMLEFRGTGNPEDGITSAWDLEILLTGTTVTAGVDLKHLYGKVFTRGTWDGRSMVTNGWGDLTSMTILGYQFSNVRGPISLKGNQLVIGSLDVVNARRENGVPVRKPAAEERITGRAIQGTFSLDGIAVLGDETSYRVVLTMRDALLERYAELYLPHQHDLRGIMTGEAELAGRGNSTRNLTGRGQLLIRPAALYQLPVMLAVLKQFNGGAADNTAFEEAQAFFEIANGRFDFKQVDLKGAALNLKGFGWVRFDRRLSFDFFSQVPRNRAPLAILQQIVGQATVGWMGIEVRGTLDNPDARIRPAQRLNEAVKQFLGNIDPRAPNATVPNPYPATGRTQGRSRTRQ